MTRKPMQTTMLTPEDWTALSSNPDTATSEYAASLQSMIFLNNKQAPFDDVRVRQALAYAFNYDQAINGLLGGHGVKLDSVAAKPYNGYAPAATQYTFDPEKAKALLEEGTFTAFSQNARDINAFFRDDLANRD